MGRARSLARVALLLPALAAAPAAGGPLLRSPADLKDKRIGVLVGSAQGTYAAKAFPSATVLQYQSAPDVVLAVKTGKVDAGLYDTEPMLVILRQDPELALLGETLFSVPVGVGFDKGNAALRARFDEFLRQIRANGVYDDMVERWVKKGDTRMPVVAAENVQGELVAGVVSDIGLPFTLVKDRRLVGFDIEMVERFAAFLGRKPVFSQMEFGSLIAACVSGKIDLVAASMFVTEERKQRIDFSEPYYFAGSSAVALKRNIAGASAAADPASPPRPPFLQRLASSFRSNILHEDRYLLILDGLKTTAVISLLSLLFGTLLGALVCFLRMSPRGLLQGPARAYISVLRGTPVLVLLMLIFYVVFASVNISPVLVAVVAFGMNFSAYAAEIFRSGIEGVDPGQAEAAKALGFTRTGAFVSVVLPQTVRRILPVYKGEAISLVKMTSIVGYIAVQDLTKASDIIRSRTFDAFFPLVMVAVLYFFVAGLVSVGLGAVERWTDPRLRVAGRRAA